MAYVLSLVRSALNSAEHINTQDWPLWTGQSLHKGWHANVSLEQMGFCSEMHGKAPSSTACTLPGPMESPQAEKQMLCLADYAGL